MTLFANIISRGFFYLFLFSLHCLSSLYGNSSILDLTNFKDSLLGTYGVHPKIEPNIDSEDQDILDQISSFLLSDPDLAVEILSSYAKRNPSAPVNFVIGTLELQNGNVSEAIHALELAIKVFPPFMRAHKNLGIAYLQDGHYLLAQSHLKKALELGDIDSLTYSALGFCYLQVGKVASSENVYRQALILSPNSIDIRNGIITCLISQNRYLEAISFIDEVASDHPDQKGYWLSYIAAYDGMAEKEEMAVSYEILRRGLGAGPMDFLRIGDLFLTLKVPRKAYSFYRKALLNEGGVEPKYAIRSINRLASLGYYQKANNLATMVLNEYGEYLNNKESLSLFWAQAKAQLAQGKKEDAKATLNSVLEFEPMHGDSLLLMGELMRSEEIATSLIYFERATNIKEVRDRALLEMGRIYANRRDWKSALSFLDAISNRSEFAGLQNFMKTIERLQGF